jgi:N-acetylglucosaminyldiphosphoundecaprenol N-acetyl-beta-D-mannosaminyltransferase
MRAAPSTARPLRSALHRPQPHAVADAQVRPAASPPLSAVEGDGRFATRVFDIDIELAEPAEMLRTISGWVGAGRPHRVMYVNAHVVNQTRTIPELRQALETADLVYCDGYGVRLAARVLETPVPHRMTGADWVWGLAALCEAAGNSLYLLGSDPPAAREAAKRLHRWYPELDVVGTHHGYFDLDSPHNERVIEDINQRDPDIVMVGMGTPKQELWVQRYGERLHADVLWTVGSLLDYIAGRVPRAPRWLADNGLEWVFRFVVEPQRMWKRYLLGNPAFLSRVMSERQRARSQV